MCRSERLKEFLEKILTEEDESDTSALKADRKCQKIYDRIRDLVLEKEDLKETFEASDDKEEKVALQLKIVRIEREFNDLLNVLSMDSMEF